MSRKRSKPLLIGSHQALCPILRPRSNPKADDVAGDDDSTRRYSGGQRRLCCANTVVVQSLTERKAIGIVRTQDLALT